MMSNMEFTDLSHWSIWLYLFLHMNPYARTGRAKWTDVRYVEDVEGLTLVLLDPPYS